MRFIRSVILSGIIILSSLTHLHAQSLEWEIQDRFRVLKNENATSELIGRFLKIRDAGKYVPLVEHSKHDDSIGTQLNIPTYWDERREQYDIQWVHNKKRRIVLHLKNAPRGAHCHWYVDEVELREANSCSDVQIVRDLDSKTKVRVAISIQNSMKDVGPIEVVPNDIFIATLGDSYAAGEGNPHLVYKQASQIGGGSKGHPALWWDTRCHRSLVSSSAQAAAFFAEKHKHTSVTYVSYACSGAEIFDGVLSSYEGRETVSQILGMWNALDESNPGDSVLVVGSQSDFKTEKSKLLRQIDRLKQILCPPKSGHWEPSEGCDAVTIRKPDFLIISIGGNDIGFGQIGRDLLLDSPQGNMAEWRRTQQDRISGAFNRLKADYENLATEIRQNIQPKQVLLVNYPDPTMYEKNLYCGKADRKYATLSGQFKNRIYSESRKQGYARNSSLYNLLLTRGEARLSQWVVHELNSKIDEASKLNWTLDNKEAAVVNLQDLVGKDGKRRGLCAPNSWFLGIEDSYLRQFWIPRDNTFHYALKLPVEKCTGEMDGDKCNVPVGDITSGIIHPNFFGHYNAGVVLLRRIESDLTLNNSAHVK